ncbi:MAG: MFS transporter [Deltaproteobacteria bacterium]|nr:MFS transporter [Deltaproteobacteria bacterium]
MALLAMATKEQQSGTVFHGWWIVLVVGVGLSLSYGPIIVATFGVFLKPLSQEFGWSRTGISLAFSLGNLMFSGALPLIGRLVDRLGARTVILPSVLIFGLSVMSFYLLTASLWHFYALYLLLGVVNSGPLSAYSKVISRWFDQQRGLALGLAMAGMGVGSFIIPPLAQALITTVGWRQAYVFLGLLVIGITMPVVGVFLKETPQRMGLWPDGAIVAAAGVAKRTGQEPGLSGREAWHTGAFWLMVGAFFLQSVGFHGYYLHLVPLLTDHGASVQSAALVMSLGAVGGMLGRVGGGYLLDRFFAPYVAVCFFCGSALGIFLLWSGAVGSLAFVAAFLGGLGVGAELDIIAYMVSRYFGLRAFGEIYGYVFAAFTLGGVIGPPLMGIGFDSTGSYSPVLGGFVVTTLMAVGLMTQMGPYRVWEAEVEPVVAAGIARV